MRRSQLVAPELRDWNCPACMKEDGEFWTEVAITYRGVLTDGKFIRLRGSARGALLICTRCHAKGRLGMHGMRGAVALWEPRKGWQFLYLDNR